MIELEPKLTVIMATYNADKYLEEALNSLLNQTYTNFIVKIIDDNSSDNTVSLIKELNIKDGRIQLVQTNDKNIGLTKNLNILIELSDTEYIARMDADDISHPERFEKQISFMENNKNVSAVGTWAYNIDENGGEIGKRYVPTDVVSIENMIGKANPMLHPTVMMRTEKIKSVNGYNEKYRLAQDYDLWYRCLAVNLELANIPEFLFSYRMIDNHVSKRKMKHRLIDAKIRWNGTRALNYALAKRIIYTSIPVILGLMPDFLKRVALKFSKHIDPRQRLGAKEEYHSKMEA
ncbi:Glycosyl transferase family 2 [Mesobacillus persicus]|uniref:Glycosyl transferase family 2 n=1 Tax=Mesobacillus persicus TaxID=930146 RepID=A0A1H8A6L3_9BACI|nr:Glycosyl transferase family 2 [Mesobacillus persicus]